MDHFLLRFLIQLMWAQYHHHHHCPRVAGTPRRANEKGSSSLLSPRRVEPGGDTPRRRNLTIDVQRKPVSISAETIADIEQIRAVYRASTTENTGSRCAPLRRARLIAEQCG